MDVDDAGFPIQTGARQEPVRLAPVPQTPLPATAPVVDMDDLAARVRAAGQITKESDMAVDTQKYTSMVDRSTPQTFKTTLLSAGDEASRDAAALAERATQLRQDAAGLAEKPGMQESRGQFLREAAAADETAQHRRGLAAALREKASGVIAS
jgi:hypothetical protein